MPARIVLPANGWRPRPHQEKLWRYLEGGGRHAIAIWHRRAGKDEVALHRTCIAAHERPATYWHCLPEYAGARKAIWEAINPHTGIRRIDEAFPRELRAATREQEMFIKFHCGSTWQVIGSDNYKDLVGGSLAGIVYSELAKAHPGAWAYFSPMLVENKGWSLAITTPEGKNHAYSMFNTAKKSPEWFHELLTIEDTARICRAHGIEPSVSLADVETQRAEYRDLYGEEAGDALIQQEWFCSFSAAILGAYFGKELELAERQGRICKVDVLPGYPIGTAWDIGVDDPMAIWVFQIGPGWLHVLDYVEGSNQGFDFYVDWLNERGYSGGPDFVPPDAKQRSPTALGARTRIQDLISLKRRPVLIDDHKIMDRINAGRRILRYAKFDEVRCAKGLEILRSYKQEWDETNLVFRQTPKHDFASHGGSAWGHLGLAVDFPKPKPKDDRPQDEGAIRVADLLKIKSERKWA